MVVKGGGEDRKWMLPVDFPYVALVNTFLIGTHYIEETHAHA